MLRVIVYFQLDRDSGVINMLLELGEVDLNKYINQHRVDPEMSAR